MKCYIFIFKSVHISKNTLQSRTRKLLIQQSQAVITMDVGVQEMVTFFYENVPTYLRGYVVLKSLKKPLLRLELGIWKQQVPITGKCSKFKGVTQPYVVKLPKSAGARHCFPTQALQLRKMQILF